LNEVSLFLLCVAGIFVLGALGEIVFQRTNVPDVIWLILAGILLGPLTGLVSRELLARVAPFFAAVTLVVVLFEGGSALRLGEVARAAPRSMLLAVLTFALACGAMAVLSMGGRLVGVLPAEWTWSHGLMLGTILGGSSSIIIMPAMAQARVAPRVANLVSLESALTDAFCVVGTTALVDIMTKGGSDPTSPALVLARSFGIALIVGLVAGMVWLLFLRFLHSSEHAYPRVARRVRGRARPRALRGADPRCRGGARAQRPGRAQHRADEDEEERCLPARSASSPSRSRAGWLRGCSPRCP